MSLSQFRQGGVSLSLHKETTTAFLFTQVNLFNVRRAYSTPYKVVCCWRYITAMVL